MKTRDKKATRAAPPISLLGTWARQGMGSFMAAQRILLDLAAQENALLLGMAREQFGKDGFQPGAALVEMADTGVKNFTAAGKILLDLAAGETEMMVEGVKEVLPLPASAGAVADLLKHRVETMIGSAEGNAGGSRGTDARDSEIGSRRQWNARHDACRGAGAAGHGRLR